MDRYIVGLCDEPELFSKMDSRGVRYYPRILEEKQFGDYTEAFDEAVALGKEKATCDFNDGTPGRCAVLLEYLGCIHDKTWAFDRDGNKKRIPDPPPYNPFKKG